MYIVYKNMKGVDYYNKPAENDSLTQQLPSAQRSTLSAYCFLMCSHGMVYCMNTVLILRRHVRHFAHHNTVLHFAYRFNQKIPSCNFHRATFIVLVLSNFSYKTICFVLKISFTQDSSVKKVK